MVDAVKILGALLSGGGMSSGSGSNILGSVLSSLGSSNQQQSNQGGGGLGGMLGGLLGGGGQSQGGGLGGMLGGLLGGGGKSANSSGGDLGSMLGGVLGGGNSGGGSSGGLSDILGSAMSQFDNAKDTRRRNVQPKSFDKISPNISHDDANQQATVMIKAMINAAKSDGRIDDKEQKQIFEKLGGDISQDEIDFIKEEVEKPINVKRFVRDVPSGLENQVYAMSLMTIDLDSDKEAQYLHKLASAMNIEPETINEIHKQLGETTLYS